MEENHTAINDKCQINIARGQGGKDAGSSMQSARDIIGHVDMSLHIPRIKGTQNISYSFPVG